MGENGIFLMFTETPLQIPRDVEEEGKTRTQDRMLFVYNVKMCWKKKKHKRKTTSEKSRGFGGLIWSLF